MNLGVPAYGRTYAGVSENGDDEIIECMHKCFCANNDTTKALTEAEASYTGLYQPFDGAKHTPDGEGTLQYRAIAKEEHVSYDWNNPDFGDKETAKFNWKMSQNWDSGQASAYSDLKGAFINLR